MKISLKKIKKWWKAIVPVLALILVLMGYGGTSAPENTQSGSYQQTVENQEESLEVSTQAKGESQTETGENDVYEESSGETEEDNSTEEPSEKEATATEETTRETTEETEETPAIDKDGIYTSAEDVALYIYTYGELPDNFMTKKEAKKLGWTSGGLEDFAPGMCIGGDYFGNYEGLLPKAKGREYHECDIDTLGKNSRGAKRIVFSNDGLIYYTDDHYESFELLYGEE